MTQKTPAALLLEISDSFRPNVPYSDSLQARVAAILTNLVDSLVPNNMLTSGAGVPVDYTDGDPPATGEGVVLPGALYIDTTNSNVYRNDGSQAEPVWVRLGDAA